MKNTRVFISSTFEDLKEYREAVQKALRKAGAIDISMENFGAVDSRPLQHCIKTIKTETDIFVGIYAHRYGYIPTGQTKSITELEFHEAVKSNLPILIFPVDENQPWLPKHIDDGDKKDKLNEFKNHLSSNYIYDKFKNKDNLASIVLAAISKQIQFKGIKNINQLSPKLPANSNEWNSHRDEIYSKNKGLFISQLIRPSTLPNQKFEIFIYIIKHKYGTTNIQEIKKVEFFFGKQWGNNVYPIINTNGYIGISINAYAEFLCTCKVEFQNGETILLEKYIDFEEGKRMINMNNPISNSA